MKKGDVVGGGLVPTDQNAPEAVQPAVSAFHYPTAGFEPSLLFDGLRLFASTPDVGGEPELVQGAAHLSEVVAFIQAQTLGVLWARCWAWHRQAVYRSPTSFMSWRLTPSTASPMGIPWASVNRLRLTPRLPGPWVGTGFSPRSMWTWSWPRPGSASSSPDPSIRHSVPVPPATAPGIPRRQPFLKAQMGGGAGAYARCVQRLPLAAGAQHVKDAVGASPVWNPRPAAAQRKGWVFTRWGSKGANTSHNSSDI